MATQKVGTDSSLQRMIRLVESTDTGEAKVVGVAGRWATQIVAVALLAATAAWFATGEIIRSVIILTVLRPCTLVLTTPTAIMARIGNATRFGILVREGDTLERLSQAKRIAFDKTDTLTYGKPAATQVHSTDDTLEEGALLALVASPELRSEHPLGRVIVVHHRQKYGALPGQPEIFELLTGHGAAA